MLAFRSSVACAFTPMTVVTQPLAGTLALRYRQAVGLAAEHTQHARQKRALETRRDRGGPAWLGIERFSHGRHHSD